MLRFRKGYNPTSAAHESFAAVRCQVMHGDLGQYVPTMGTVFIEQDPMDRKTAIIRHKDERPDIVVFDLSSKHFGRDLRADTRTGPSDVVGIAVKYVGICTQALPDRFLPV